MRGLGPRRRGAGWSAGLPLAFLLVAAAPAEEHSGLLWGLIETLLPKVTHDMIRIEGLSGLPNRLRAARLEVRDATGAYLVIENVALDWSPTRLIRGEVEIDRLDAETATFSRLPKSEPSASPSGGLPKIHLDVKHLRVTRLDIAPAVAGRAMALRVEGDGELTSPTTGRARLDLATADPRPGGTPDRYALDAAFATDSVKATLRVDEAPNGLVAGLAGLPDLGAITLDAAVDGPFGALATRAALTAGQLRAKAEGTVDTEAGTADLTVSATAPAMRPRPDVAWESVALQAQLHGPFKTPDATGTLTVTGLEAAGAGADTIRADLSGAVGGEATLKARIDGARIPGPKPLLLAGAPLTLEAATRLDNAKRPVRFSLRHPLLSADGTGEAGDTGQNAHVNLAVPDLAPFAALGGTDLRGRAKAAVDATRTPDGTLSLAARGTVSVTGGIAPAPALVGDAGAFDVAATIRGPDISLTRLTVEGKAFAASANGRWAGNQVGLDWTLALRNLAAIQPSVSGTLAAKGRLSGAPSDLSATADLTAEVATAGFRTQRLTAQLAASGLPDAPRAQLTAGGSFLDAPVSLVAAVERTGGATRITIPRGTWKSLTAGGTLEIAANAAIPTGQLRVAMTDLGNLEPLLGRKLGGGATATFDASPAANRVSVALTRLAVPGTLAVEAAALRATITGPTDRPEIDGSLTLDGVAASGVRGAGRVTARGPVNALALDLGADLADLAGAPAQIKGAGTLDGPARALRLSALRTDWRGETLRLLAPVRVGLAPDVTVDRLRLGVRRAELEIAGRASPTLDLRVRLSNLPADLAAVVAPEYAADGTLNAEARLTGSPVRPDGTVRVTASGLRLRSGPGRALPPAGVTVNAALAGGRARLDGRVAVGASGAVPSGTAPSGTPSLGVPGSNVTTGSSVALAGTAPLDATGPLDLRLNGTVDAALLNPLLAAGGRYAKGKLTLALGIGGTPSAPRARGTASLTGGDFQDFGTGVRVSDIAATVLGDGETIRLTKLAGRAGPGTISGEGTFSLAAPHRLDVRLRADNARLVSSDLITAHTDANLSLTGALSGGAAGGLSLGGTVLVRRADIQVPERLPPSIAVLPTRDAGKPRPKPAPPAAVPDVALALTLDAPREIYIRGRGLDVELGGRVVFSGTAARPVPRGGFQLRRGAFSLAGQNLKLTEGTIDFANGTLTDPSLKLVATSTSAALIAQLTVSGRVTDPRIALSSTPDVPQDEILAQLLFNSARSKLGPFQLAQIAAALASIVGVSSPIGDPLAKIRNALGLDQLSVGSGASGNPTLEAGRYIAPGVRVGARQGTGGDTQATLQIDIAKGLKLETTAGTGSSSASGGASGNSGTGVGILYQFEY